MKKIKKLIVCGGRTYSLTAAERARFAGFLYEMGVQTLIHGAARGVDTEAAEIASQMGIEIVAYRADWKRYQIDGKKNPAGVIRNREMASSCDARTDACLAFTGGQGTKDMVRVARKSGLTVFDWRKDE